MTVPTKNDGIPGVDAIKALQLTDGKSKSSEEYGIAVSKKIWDTVNKSGAGYYSARNARYTKNRNYANGRLDVYSMFRDRFNFEEGKKNYIALNWNTLQIPNRIISGLVGRWMTRSEKVAVTAIDPLSVKNKQDEYERAEVLMMHREIFEMLEQESGVQPENPDQFVPEDKEELYLWQQRFQHLPEEILFQTGCNDVIDSNGFYDVMKEKLLHDAAEVLFVGTYTWMDTEGVVHIRRVKPEDAIYSYSEYPDFRDTTWRGEAPVMKISEIRRMYGKEFGGKLTEKDLWDIAQHAKEFRNNSNLSWEDSWDMDYFRPYDEWNVKSLQFEIKTVDKDYYTVTKTKISNSTYVEKGMPQTASGKKREKPLDNQRVVEDRYWNIYGGVYLPDCDKLLEWERKKNMIRPQDPKEIGNAEFSYSFYMPQNYNMRNMAIPEKIEAAVDGMILSLLKMQQVVARMRPVGAAINEDALQNIDYGLGEQGNKAVDYKKLYDQTGDVYYRGRDAEGNPIPLPITELANSGFLGQMDGLIRNYQFNYQILKDELGEDPNLISAALQPRVTSGNVEYSQMQAEFATDYIYKAYAYCMADTARKISCLLGDSVKYGSKVYHNLLKQEDVSGRQFATKIQFLPTSQEIAKFEALLNQAIASNPELVLFVDPFMLMRVAKDDVELAETVFRRGQKKMLIHQQAVAVQNQQATIEGQIQAAKVAEEEKRNTKAMEVDGDIKKADMTAQAQNRTAVLAMAAALLQKQQETGSPIPSSVQPLINAVVENVMVSAISATEEQKQQILANMQAMQEQQAMEQGGQPMEQQPTEEQPFIEQSQPFAAQNVPL